MPPLRCSRVAAILEAFTRERSDRLQHPEAIVRPSHETLQDERLQRVEVRIADFLRRREGAPTEEHRQVGEEALFDGRQEIVTPRDRRAQGDLSRIRVTPGGEQIQPLREAFQDLWHGQCGTPCRGELDREWQIVEARAQLRDVRRDFGLCACAEQLDRFGFDERNDGIPDLSSHPQQLPAGNQNLEVRTAFEDLDQRGPRVDHLLEVVEHQEHLPVADLVGERRRRSQRSPHDLEDDAWIADRRELGPEHARCVLGDELGRHLDAEASLPRSTRPRQRDEPGVTSQQSQDVVDLLSPPDEGACWPGKVRVRDGLQWREELIAELEDLDRTIEVLEAMLTEIDHRIGITQERPGRDRHDHLAAMARGSDARSLVHVETHVPLVGQGWLAGMETHPNTDRAGRKGTL